MINCLPSTVPVVRALIIMSKRARCSFYPCHNSLLLTHFASSAFAPDVTGCRSRLRRGVTTQRACIRSTTDVAWQLSLVGLAQKITTDAPICRHLTFSRALPCPMGFPNGRLDVSIQGPAERFKHHASAGSRLPSKCLVHCPTELQVALDSAPTLGLRIGSLYSRPGPVTDASGLHDLAPANLAR